MYPDTLTALTPALSQDRDYWALPVEERQRILIWLETFNRYCALLDGGLSSRKAIPRLVASLRESGRGFGQRTMESLLPAYAKSRDWRVFRREWQAPKGLPTDFLAHWQSLAAKGPRADNRKAAYKELLNQWYADAPIPGYGRLSEWWPANRPGLPLPRGVIREPGDLPTGWDYSNLTRRLPKQKAVTTLAKRGFHAAHDYLPQLLRDRSNLRPLELITFDDVRLDLQAIFDCEGGTQVAYIQGLFALDVATGCIIAHGLKPRLEQDNGRRLGLSRDDTRHLFLSALESGFAGFRGLPNYTINALLENAAAALTEADKQAFAQVFGDHLSIETTGMMRRTLISGGFVEEGGMPWQKGWIEAYFRMLHTSLNHLPGTTGSRYDNDPGDLDGRLAYTRQLIRQAEKSPSHKDKIIWPLLTGEQASAIIGEIVQRLNCRTDHALQGFSQIYRFRHPCGQLLSLEQLQKLAPEDRLLCVGLPPRREAPIERFRRLAEAVTWTPVHPAALAILADRKHRVTLRNCEVKLSVKALEAEPMRFRLPPEITKDAERYEGREYLAALSSDRTILHLLDERMAYVTSLPRLGRVDLAAHYRGESSELLNRAGEVHRERQQIAQQAAALRADESAHLTHARAHNAALFATAEAMQSAERTRKATPQRDPLYDAPKGQAASLAAAAEAARQALLEDADTF